MIELEVWIHDGNGKDTERLLRVGPDGTVIGGGGITLGQLQPDGSLVFANTGGSVVASIRDGRVEVTAAPGYAGPFPGQLTAKDFADYGGTIRSGYVIGDNGVARIGLAHPLVFADSGELTDADSGRPTAGLRLRDATAAKKMTAMFLYIVLTVVTH